MSKDLKRLFGLREMAVNVPDKEVPGLRRAIKAAVNSKILPPDANNWVQEKPAGEKPGTGKAEKPKWEPSGDEFDEFDIDNPKNFAKSMGAAGSPGPKKAQATGKKPSGFDSKLATRTAKPSKAQPKPVDADLEDDWFQDDIGKTDAEEPAGDELPSFPGSAAYKAQNAPKLSKGIDPEDADAGPAPFSAAAYGGGSSWDDVPDWVRDPERMPAPGDAPLGSSWKVPSSQPPEDDDVGTVPGKLPKRKKTVGKSPVGAPWSAKDVKGSPDEDPVKKPGMLSRIFGRKK